MFGPPRIYIHDDKFGYLGQTELYPRRSVKSFIIQTKPNKVINVVELPSLVFVLCVSVHQKTENITVSFDNTASKI